MKKSNIIIIALFILGFVGFKAYLLNKYITDKQDIDTSVIFKDEIDIKLKDYKGKIFTYEGLSFRNDFTDYKKNDNNWYVKKDKEGNVIAAIYLSKMEQYHDLLTDGNLKIISGDSEELANKLFLEEDKISFLEEYNIRNDIDLLKYIKDNYYLKNTIFTNQREMKQNYIVNSFVEISLPSFSKINLIKGDLTGYILYASENIRQIHILNGDYQYIISLVGEKLVKEDYITSLLETVKIK